VRNISSVIPTLDEMPGYVQGGLTEDSHVNVAARHSGDFVTLHSCYGVFVEGVGHVDVVFYAGVLVVCVKRSKRGGRGWETERLVKHFFLIRDVFRA